MELDPKIPFHVQKRVSVYGRTVLCLGLKLYVRKVNLNLLPIDEGLSNQLNKWKYKNSLDTSALYLFNKSVLNSGCFPPGHACLGSSQYLLCMEAC